MQPAQPQPTAIAPRTSSSGCIKALLIVVFGIGAVVAAIVGVGWLYIDHTFNYEPTFEVGGDELWSVGEAGDSFTVARVKGGDLDIRHVFPHHDVVWFRAEDGTHALFDIETLENISDVSRISTDVGPVSLRSTSSQLLDLETHETSDVSTLYYQVPGGVWVFEREREETRFGFFESWPEGDPELSQTVRARVYARGLSWNPEANALFLELHSDGCKLVRFRDGEGRCVVLSEHQLYTRGPAVAIVKRPDDSWVWHDLESSKVYEIVIDGCAVDVLGLVPRGRSGRAVTVGCGKEAVKKATWIWAPDGATKLDHELSRSLERYGGLFSPTISTVFLDHGRQPVGAPPAADEIVHGYYLWKRGVYRLDFDDEKLHKVADWPCDGSTRYGKKHVGADFDTIVASCQEWQFDEASGTQKQYLTSSIVLEPSNERVTVVPFHVTHVTKNYFVGYPDSFVEDFQAVVAAPRNPKE